MKSVSDEYRNKSDKRGAQLVPIGIQINSLLKKNMATKYNKYVADEKK